MTQRKIKHYTNAFKVFGRLFQIVQAIYKSAFFRD